MGSGDFRPGNKLLRALDDTAYRRLAGQAASRPAQRQADSLSRQRTHPASLFPGDRGRVLHGGDERRAARSSRRRSASKAPRGCRRSSGSPRHRTKSSSRSPAAPASSTSTTSIARCLQNDQFSSPVNRHVHALLLHSMRMTACTGLHSLEQRCARWFLIALDRVLAGSLAITHEFLGHPPRRGTAVGERRDRRLPETRNPEARTRTVLVTDREALLAASCECYDAIQRAYDHVHR